MIPIKGGSRWLAWADAVTARFPLAATDWEQHSDAVEAGLYSVRNRSSDSWPAADSVHIYADSEPLSPEEEEAAYAVSLAPSQMELF